MMNRLNLLLIADPHYTNRAGPGCGEPDRFGRHALEWIRVAVNDARSRGPLDGIALLGDLVDNPAAPGAWNDLADMAAFLRTTGLPVIVVPGNHDFAPERTVAAFGDRLGPHDLNGFLLYTFAEQYDSSGLPVRAATDLDAFSAFPASGPVIALQHPPLYPPVDCAAYPYMPANTAQILDTYARRRVLLAISGHYHAGGDTAVKDGVTYLTCAALAERPFAWYRLHVRDDALEVEKRTVRTAPVQTRIDVHVHTPFAYCAEDVTPDSAIAQARAQALQGIVCTEHSPHLYFSAEDYGRGEHVERPDALHRAQGSPADRMAAFRRTMAPVRSDFVRIGLEVECDREGGLVLREEDRSGWDLLLGAVHRLPASDSERGSARMDAAFLRLTERLCAHGVHVLAHPFRYYFRGRLQRPTHLYRPMAKLLAAYGVAAEINYHTNEPDPEFFRLCAEEGVRLVLGSDAHQTREVGDFDRHRRLLDAIGCAHDDIA